MRTRYRLYRNVAGLGVVPAIWFALQSNAL
jgi:hypothetical protein